MKLFSLRDSKRKEYAISIRIQKKEKRKEKKERNEICKRKNLYGRDSIGVVASRVEIRVRRSEYFKNLKNVRNPHKLSLGNHLSVDILFPTYIRTERAREQRIAVLVNYLRYTQKDVSLLSRAQDAAHYAFPA